MGVVKHGMRGTRIYNIWVSIKQRTNNTNAKDYPRYGGRGIDLSESWHDFINFKDDMYKSYISHVKEYGEADTQIDRTDNNLGYSKSNCRWVTIRENLNNRTTYAKVGTNGRKTNWGNNGRRADY